MAALSSERDGMAQLGQYFVELYECDLCLRAIVVLSSGVPIDQLVVVECMEILADLSKMVMCGPSLRERLALKIDSKRQRAGRAPRDLLGGCDDRGISVFVMHDMQSWIEAQLFPEALL
ncbi:hypothetical protein KQX63_10370 [Rhodopseudomonas palustris]|uniref:hypothetical protein n=1 Tax=Rhodopseudomonas palustris TaxID=1076 RepID=UPI0021F3B72D|nr:hypothetical protein [Rhodopseudomonas palustris]UYO46380.1 hypothetical protein KQX63_10370 [Rhodopseudomonas palustris]